MHFLITNDDGIDAPGLQALAEAASRFGQVSVVAPCDMQSGCSHRVSDAFSVHEKGAGRFAVEGTPADCVRVALHGLLGPVDWILSGINHGGNLGTDVHHSGTVAAVREGALYGKPGIAVSHYRGSRTYEFDWQRAGRWLQPVLEQLLRESVSHGEFFNVNLPSVLSDIDQPQVITCPVDRSPLHVDYEIEGRQWRYSGVYQNRPRRSGHDVDVCFGGAISVSRLGLH